MNISDKAIENAISIEVKKDALRQMQSGDWQVRFTVAALDMDNRITAARMGTRYACVLVEVDDDETPVDHVARARDKWRDLGPVQQAGIRCKEPMFWAWLREAKRYGVTDEFGAAVAVRDLCGVTSRSELGKPGNSAQRVLWHDLDTAFHGWKVREHG